MRLFRWLRSPLPRLCETDGFSCGLPWGIICKLDIQQWEEITFAYPTVCYGIDGQFVGFSYWKWWFSMAMWNYKRVPSWLCDCQMQHLLMEVATSIALKIYYTRSGRKKATSQTGNVWSGDIGQRRAPQLKGNVNRTVCPRHNAHS